MPSRENAMSIVTRAASGLMCIRVACAKCRVAQTCQQLQLV